MLRFGFLIIFMAFILTPVVKAEHIYLPVVQSQLNALVHLYQSTGGKHWLRDTNWLDGDVCHWHGVTCTAKMKAQGVYQQQITMLGLVGLGLHGQIPASIGDLSDLHLLDLSANRFTGRIPTSLGHRRQLESLNLSANQLSGSIPDTRVIWVNSKP
jgi:Leucine-rich repeat (LRR) protein